MTESQLYSRNEISYEKTVEKTVTRKILTTFILSACLILVTYILYQQPSIQRKFFYPLPYREAIETYSEKFNVDRNLSAAIIKNESNFNHRAESYVGAIGLMQLMPDTAKWISMELNESNFYARKLHNPEVNIRYGVYYLSMLENEFNGNDVLTIAAYNAGSGNVHDWIEKYHWSKNFSDVNQIPYAETREFVKKVLACKEKYRELY